MCEYEQLYVWSKNNSGKKNWLSIVPAKLIRPYISVGGLRVTHERSSFTESSLARRRIRA